MACGKSIKERLVNAGFERPGLVLAWGLYDVANQFFAVNMVSLYFIFWAAVEKGVPENVYSWFYAGSLFLVAAAIPLLSAVSDMTGRRRPYLIFFTLLSIFFYYNAWPMR